MNDDTTAITPAAPVPLSARLDAFRADPSDDDLYRALRDELREQRRPDVMAELGELRAPHEAETERRLEIWHEVAALWTDMGEPNRVEHALNQVLELDPADELAARTLVERYTAEARYAEAADILEDELHELKLRTTGDDSARPATGEDTLERRANGHRALAQLWEDQLGRVDQALNHWQQAWHLEPKRTDALASARAIYASLGDDKMVARLYEAELEVLGNRGPAERRAELKLELGRIAARQGDPAGAAGHFEAALKLNRESLAVREALAEIYASPHFSGQPDIRPRAGELLVDLGQRRLAENDENAGIGFLRRALEVQPDSRLAAEALEQALTATERWEELDQLYQLSLGNCTAEERMQLLHKRAELYEDHLNDRTALKGILIELAAQSPPLGQVSQRLRALYSEDEDWAALASHIESELPAIRDDRARSSAEMLELATIVREHLGNRDRAAEILHHILLDVDPTSAEALARYGDHFRERRDWRGLADLLDFATDNARDAGAPASQLVRQLEEIAQICETRMGDIDRAIATWRRIQEMEPDSPKPPEAIRRLMSRAKMWESLVGVLEREAEAAQSPEQRAEALRRIAQVYRERQVNPRRAIALYEEVISLVPDDRGVLKALSELYDRDGDDAGVAHTLRRTLDHDIRAMAAESQFSSPKEWPVAKRAERLTSLRRLISMYERLGDLEGVVFASSGVIEMLPGDRDALDRMERALEQAGDLVRLEQTLDYHVRAASGPAERAKIQRRMARIAVLQDD
ncbi:MAG: hypothetical protein AAGC55_12785, partial [Myxococcota bacterium]